MGCTSVGNCPDVGTESGSDCSWDRILCVSCFEDSGVVRIKAQSNGLPNHCYKSPTDIPTDIQFDFKVDWMADHTSYTTDATSIDIQDDLDDLICNIMRSKDDNIPSEVNYEITSD